MAPRFGDRRLVLVLNGVFSIAAARHRTRVGAASAELSHLEVTSGGIPSWKLDMTMNPEQFFVNRAMQMQSEDPASGSSPLLPSAAAPSLPAAGGDASAEAFAHAAAASASEDGSAFTFTSTSTSTPAAAEDVNGHEDAYVSTAGQDSQACPLLKLPGLLRLEMKSTSWMQRSGSMEDYNSVAMAFWSQNLLTQRWRTIYFRDVDGKLALKAVPMDKDTLSSNYDWAPKNMSTDYDLYTEYKRDLRQEINWIPETDTSKTWVALLDCAGDLLFVFLLQAGEPGHTDIYDRYGYFLAHSLNDAIVARYQWIDTEGRLLATAESPGLGENISRAQLPTDDAYGGILFYELGYEEGGYQNASKLMDVEYRWVIASAMQVSAVYEAQDGWVPPAQYVVAVASACCAVLGAIILCCGCFYIYGIVFPAPSVRVYRGSRTWAKTVNPFLWVPDASARRA